MKKNHIKNKKGRKKRKRAYNELIVDSGETAKYIHTNKTLKINNNETFSLIKEIDINKDEESKTKKEKILQNSIFIYKNVQFTSINIPASDDEIAETNSFRKNNNFVYHLIYSYSNINYQILKQHTIIGDGNCFFRNISFFYSQKEIYHPFFRNFLYEYLNNNKQDIIDNYPDIEVNDILTKTVNYIPKICRNGNFAGFFELGYVIKILDLNIVYIKKKIIIII